MVENKIYFVRKVLENGIWYVTFRDNNKEVFKKDASLYSQSFLNKLPGYFCCVDGGGAGNIKDISVRYEAYVVKRSDWNKIPQNYRGKFSDTYGEHPEWKGRNTVFAGCIGGFGTTLLIEGVHFVIV